MHFTYPTAPPRKHPLLVRVLVRVVFNENVVCLGVDGLQLRELRLMLIIKTVPLRRQEGDRCPAGVCHRARGWASGQVTMDAGVRRIGLQAYP